MNLLQIVGLGIRLFAIFVAIQSFEYLIRLPAGFNNTNPATYADASYGIGTLILVVALLLWIFPLAIANRLTPKIGVENKVNLQAFDVARVGSSLIGLWFLATAIPGVLWFLFRGAAFATTPGQSIFGALATDDKIRLAYYAAQLLLSFVLIFKSHVFASIATRNMEILKNDDQQEQ